MNAAHQLAGNVQRVTADFGHGTGAAQLKAFGAADGQAQVTLAHVVDAEVRIKQADEGADGARGVVVFGLAQQEGAAAFEVAQVDVIAQGGADHLAACVDGQHDFGLGVVPGRGRVNADVGTCANGRQHRAFGENFSVGADAHFQVLRPGAARDQHLFDTRRFGRAGHDVLQVVAQNAAELTPDGVGPAGIAAGLLFNDALEQAGDKGHAAGLDGLQVTGRQQPGLAAVALAFIAVGQHRVQQGHARQLACTQRAAQCAYRIAQVEQLTDGGGHTGRVMQRAIGRQHHGGADAGLPQAADEGGFSVFRQGGFKAALKRCGSGHSGDLSGGEKEFVAARC